MDYPSLTYADVVTKQCVEAWAEGLDFDFEEHVMTHLEQLFDIKSAEVVDASPDSDAIRLNIVTDRWTKPKQFVLDRNGSLWYSR